MSAAAIQLGILEGILNQEDPLMPKIFQNSKLLIRKDVSRPYYFIRATVVKIAPTAIAKRLGQSTS